MMKIGSAFLLTTGALIILAACSQKEHTSSYRTPPAFNDGWKTASADSAGVDSPRLASLTETIRAWPELGIHAVLIERGDRLIYEEYFDGFDERLGQSLGRISMTRESLHDIRSASKSVVSALVGIAVAEKTIPSLDTPVLDWFPEYPHPKNDEQHRMTLRHFVTMTSGLEWNESLPYSDPQNDAIRMTHDILPLHYVLSRPMAKSPGSEFNYNSGLAEAAGAIVERATKTSLNDYARIKLFEPLGITHYEWIGNLAGKPEAASGLRLRARDFAKFASLYLHGGRWQGTQVLPQDWVEVSTRRSFRFPSAGAEEGESGYGYFWWYFCYPTKAGRVEVRTAFGNGQQWAFIMPGLDMAVIILGGRYNDLTTGATLGTKILRQHLIPAVQTSLSPGCPGLREPLAHP
jgi:CubicO group peptidase (beta-lactamase class C family)